MNINLYKYLKSKEESSIKGNKNTKNQSYKNTDHKPQSSNKTKPTKVMTLSIFLISLLSLSPVVFSDDASFQKLPVPGNRSGTEAFAIDSTGKGFYTGVSGGKILSYTPGKGYIEFAYMTKSS